MKEVFERLDQFHANRPEAAKSNIWYVEKVRHEEASELLEVTYNEPTPEQAEEMLKEGVDVILNILQLCRNSGLGYLEVEQGLLSKIEELENRPAESFFRPIRVDIYEYNDL